MKIIGACVVIIFVVLGSLGFSGLPVRGDLPDREHEHDHDKDPTRVVQTVTITPTVFSTETPSVTVSPSVTPDFTITPTPTNTLTPNPTNTLTPVQTVTVTPSSTLTPVRAIFPIGIRLANDKNVISFWNQTARFYDFAHATSINDLMQITIAEKQYAIGTLAEVPNAIVTAKQNNVNIITMNEEGPTCTQLISDEQAAEKLIHNAGLKFIFVPTGFKLQTCLDLALYADEINFQTEFLQYKPFYKLNVQNTIQDLRNKNPSLIIQMQISVNPPQRRDAPVMDIIGQLDQVQDNTSRQADKVNIYYAAAGVYPSTPDRPQAMMEVIANYRH